MIKNTLTYMNFNDEKVTKDFWFHLGKADMIELAIDGAFEQRLKAAIASEDKLTLFQEFKKLIFLSVGVRSEDGESFMKPEIFRETFMSSPAFDALIDYLFSNPDKAADFVAGLLPADSQEQARKEIERVNANPTVDPFAEEPTWIRDRRTPTPAEFAAATEEQKKIAFSFALGKKES